MCVGESNYMPNTLHIFHWRRFNAGSISQHVSRSKKPPGSKSIITWLITSVGQFGDVHIVVGLLQLEKLLKIYLPCTYSCQEFIICD